MTAEPYTLLLRIDGPMQAWGASSLFEHRETLGEPTKSGVIGLICAALGRTRDEPIDDLAALRMAVRVDAAGQLEQDLHTASDIARASWRGKQRTKESHEPTKKSWRDYLCDAAFVVALEGTDIELLGAIHQALQRPRFLVSLGRRACPPAAPLALQAPVAGSAEEALQSVPPLRGQARELPVVSEVSDFTEADRVINDQPLSFASRRFAPRGVRERTVVVQAERL